MGTRQAGGSLRHGQLVKGSTRPLVQVSRSQAKLVAMMNQLDENNREIEMQRLEIRRLREQVHVLMNQLGPQFSNSQQFMGATGQSIPASAAATM